MPDDDPRLWKNACLEVCITDIASSKEGGFEP